MPAAPPDAECYVGYGIQPVLARVYDAGADALCNTLRENTS